ncbi:MAG: MGMT family protein [Sulfurovum sp.]|nr:MGMT family protein [Sulfurovum sp.]
MATSFQKAVWEALKRIPRGKVTTYGAIAAHLNTKAVRAVGSAVGQNPYAPEVPCHRVVNAGGRLGNYSGEGGKSTKKRLLEREGVVVKNDRIMDFGTHFFDYTKER